MSAIEAAHAKRLEDMFFADPDGTPSWLRALPGICRDRYSKIKLTDQFRAAISAFDDENEAKPFELFVVGEGKFGKSTIVNCLLGQELAKVQGLPETRCFNRYIFKVSPSDTAKIFLKTNAGMHEWLTAQLDEGKPVKELFEVFEYELPLTKLGGIIKDDISRQENCAYDQAIYEIEREVKHNNLSPFKREVRVVDTQGFDQIFPSDIKTGAKINDSSSKDACYSWMHETPRGRHLDWQFRRCDAVLWCINAKKLNSAATREYLGYFSQYSKKIIIALTHIDICRTEKDRVRLTSKANELYSAYSNTIVPINGKLAWDGISNSDEQKYESSGLQELVKNLVHICDNDGIRVRNFSRYNGLRQTEKQYRNALVNLRQDYMQLREKYVEDISLIDTSRKRVKNRTSENVKRLGVKYLDDVLQNVVHVSLDDNINEVESKLKTVVTSIIYREAITNALDGLLLAEVNNLDNRISPYQIPFFDADGERSGYVVSRHIDVRHDQVTINLPSLRLQPADFFDRMANKIDGFIGIFSSAARQRKVKRIYDFHDGIEDDIRRSWINFIKDASLGVNEKIDRQFDDIENSVERVMSKIERDSGSSLPNAIKSIDQSLSGIAVPNIVIDKMVKLFGNILATNVVEHIRLYSRNA